MKRVYSYITILFLILSCAKDEPVPTIGNLRGKITDAETSSPLKDVNVEIGGTSYTTGSDGAYFFNNLVAATYTISVSKTGYIADSKSVQVRAEQTATSDFILSKNLPQIQPSSISVSDQEESKSVTLKNNQADPIGFSTQVSKTWISVAPSSGTIAANSQTILNISIDFDEMDFGTFNESLVINVSGSTLTVPIVVTKSQPSFINILQPQENGIYAPEEIMSILWESNLNGSVDINLLRSGSSSIFRIIKESAENDEGGSYNWTIPELDQGQYRVQIISKEEVSVSDITGNFIIGTDPSIPFIQSEQVFNYVEGQEAGFIIGTLEASDDVGIEKFEIVSGNSQGYFEISQTGKIILTDEGATSPANDFEEDPNEFILSIKAIDGDGNESSTVEIAINVVDFDDQAPTISTDQSFTYSEGRSTSYLIGQIDATDNVGISSFEITSGNQNNYFIISDSGEIRLTSDGESSPANDFEQEPNAFTIKVKAFDQSENASEEVSIDLIVVDTDDISPVVEENQSFSYDEGQSTDYIIGNVVASDNVEVTQFRIISGNENSYFAITSSGDLKLTSTGAAVNAASNDYEVVPNEFTLALTALDETGNESNVVPISISINNVEENESGLVLFLDAGNDSSYNGGNIWYDLSGNENNATLVNTSFDEANGGSLVFDGTAFADITNEFYNNGWKNYTISMWVKTTDSQKDSQTFYNTIPHDGEALGWNWQNSKSIAHSKANIPDNENNWDVVAQHKFGYEALDNNKWINVTLTLDSTSYKYYLDGEEIEELVVNNENTTGLTGLRLGNIKDFGENEALIGNIGSFQIYNQTLSTSDIRELYQSSTSRFSNSSRFFKDSNGVTVKCENCSPGDTGIVDGVTYTAVNRTQLDQLIASNSDLTRICTTLVTDMSYLLAEKTSFNQDISSWDTSNVTSMKMMFRLARAFNIDISNWDTSNVTSMEGTFYAASAFNKPLNKWDVSSVTDFRSMFSTADLFNQPLDQWDTSNATNMADMFFSADRFNQNINSWDVSNVTVMHGMFWGAHAFNQPLNQWNTSKVISTTYMFAGAYEGYSTFNQDISSWDVSNVEEMQYMFSFNRDFNKPLNEWNVSKVQNMEGMFSNASSFNQHLDEWNTESLIKMNGIFQRATVFNGRINTWKTSKVNDLTDIFYFAQSFNQPLDNWDVSSVRALNGTFSTSGFNQNINNWDTSNVEEMTNTFSFSPFNQPLDQWDTSKVRRFYGMFMYALDYNQDIEGWDVSNVYDFIKMFEGAEKFNQPLDNWNTSNADSFLMMFQGASSFNQPLNNWNTSNVVSMQKMFKGAESFDQPLNNWNTSKVEDMQEMFSTWYGDSQASTKWSVFNSNINSWNTSNVRHMYAMFHGNQEFNQDISDWDVSNVIEFTTMFNGATSFNQPIGKWNTQSLLNIHTVFEGATAFNQNINDWDVSKVDDFSRAFNDAKSFNQPLDKWNTVSATAMYNMFSGAENFNQNLSGWCVENLTTIPDNFATGSQLQSDYYPVWGTCPTSLERSLLAFYSLNGNTNDSGPNGVDGQLYNGANYTEDKMGNANRALILDGEDDYLDIGSNTLFNLSDGFSMAFWIKVDERPDSSVQVFTHPNNEQFQISYTPQGQIKFFVKTTTSSPWVSATANLPTSVFSHIVVTYDSPAEGDSPIGSIYLNGELVEYFALSKGLISPGDTAHSRNIIGGIIRPNENVLIEAFKGVIDEIGLWRRRLTTEEVKQLFDSY